MVRLHNEGSFSKRRHVVRQIFLNIEAETEDSRIDGVCASGCNGFEGVHWGNGEGCRIAKDGCG